VHNFLRKLFVYEPFIKMKGVTKMKDVLLITGATGNLGREVVKALLIEGYAVRAGTRNVDAIQSEEHLEAAKLDYTDASTFDKALLGVSGILLVAPPMDPEAPAKLIPFIEKAKEVGVKHIVFISALGVDQNEQSPLRVIELALMESGIAYTILRSNFFMENFSLGFIAPMIKQQNGIFLAADDGKTSFISTKDIAAVAVKSFADALYGKEFNLTGPEAFDHTQVAKIIGNKTGKAIAYHALTKEAMLQGARDQGMPEGAVQYMAVLYAVVRAGYMAAVTDDVEKVTGCKPITFKDFVDNNAESWT
jgi:uncharacterized protein YbjT (DUF2867 family)